MFISCENNEEQLGYWPVLVLLYEGSIVFCVFVDRSQNLLIDFFLAL